MQAAPCDNATLPVRAEVIADARDIGPLADEWRRLFATTASEPSTSFEWTAAMLRHHVKDGDRLFLVRITRAGVVVGLVPLLARYSAIAGNRIMVLSPLSNLYSTHGGLLMRGLDGDMIEAFVHALDGLDLRWDVFKIIKLLDESPLGRLLEAAAQVSGLDCNVQYTSPAYVLSLPATYDSYLSGRSGKLRNYLRRMSRKLDAAGRVEVRTLRTAEEFDEMYSSLLDVERVSWKHEHGTAISAVARQAGFYRALGREAAIAGRLHFQIMSLDGRPIAYNFGYLHRNTYYYLKTSYDERCRALSPATVLRGCLVADLIERGVRCLDFPGEPYEWERQWTDTYRWHTAVTIYSHTLKARAVRWLTRLKGNNEKPAGIRHSDPLAIKAPSR